MTTFSTTENSSRNPARSRSLFTAILAVALFGTVQVSANPMTEPSQDDPACIARTTAMSRAW